VERLIRGLHRIASSMFETVERVGTAGEADMRRILLVDDDPHVCLAIQVWLKRYGFKIAIADSGANGLVALNSPPFDLMIVDIFMPHMRGFESIRVFHDRAPTVPLIAISGYAFSGPEASSPDFVSMALKLGATRCLRKPFRPATLLSVIDDCLSEVGPHRKYVATLAAVTTALSEPQGGAKLSNMRLGGFHEYRGLSESGRQFDGEVYE
jgi:CheY-like chemotaxis protein